MERRPEAKGELSDETDNDLQMAPELMLELAHKAAEFLVARTETLPGENAWDGEFREGLEKQLLKDPLEDGRSPMESFHSGCASPTTPRPGLGRCARDP